MKIHVWNVAASLWYQLTGNSDGSVHADITKVGGTPVAAGAAVKAASIPVNIASDQLGAAAKAASLSMCLATDQVGPAAKASALAVTMATDQPPQKVRGGGSYETVAASQTAQALGAAGAAGDYLEQLIIVPATTSPGAVSIKDGAGGDITVFTGGATSVANLSPIVVSVRAQSAAGAWAVTTGAAVSVIASGVFT